MQWALGDFWLTYMFKHYKEFDYFHGAAFTYQTMAYVHVSHTDIARITSKTDWCNSKSWLNRIGYYCKWWYVRVWVFLQWWGTSADWMKRGGGSRRLDRLTLWQA